MYDPAIQMELMEKGMKKTVPGVTVPEDLTKEKLITYFKEANEHSIQKFKDYLTIIKTLDPMLAPIVHSCISHDYVFKTYNIPEAIFKVAMFKYDIYSDKDLQDFMSKKQMEI